MKIGEIIYLDGVELMVTSIRLDRTVQGSTAMILLSDPILYTKEKMDRDAREELVRKQTEMTKVVTEHLAEEK